MRKIVFDIETSNMFSEVGVNDPAALTISVVGVYDSATDKYSAYLENELKQLWPIIEKADVLIGYNSDHFDVPLLDKYYPGDLRKIRSLDLMKEVKNVLGRRIKLNTLAEATLGRNKTGDGLEAIRLWKAGEIEKVKAYCLEDVKITKELYEYILLNKKVKYQDNQTIKELILDTSNWENQTTQSITHTLPF